MDMPPPQDLEIDDVNGLLNVPTEQTRSSKIVDVLTGRWISSDTDRARFYLGWIGSVFAVTTALAVTWGILCLDKARLKDLVLPFLVLWTAVPPMYFWFDYFVLWHLEKKRGSSQFVDLAEFKHGQELSRNLWLAIVAVLAAIYTSK